MRDLTSSGWRAAVALAVALLAAGPAGAADVVLENLRFRVGEISYTAPRAEFRGTPHDRAELTALLDQASPEPVSSRIGRIQAAEIVVPEILSELATPQGPQVTRYRDVVFSGMGGGRLASVAASGGSLAAQGPQGRTEGTFGRFGLQEFDLALAASLFAETAGAGSPEMKRLYGAFSLEALQLTDPSGATTQVGRIFGRDFAARPTRDGWLGAVAAIGKNPDLRSAPPEDRKRSFEALADLLGAFQVGAVEAIDVAFKARDGEGSGRIARIGFQGASGARRADLSIEGFEAGSAEGGRVRFRSLGFGGISLQPMLDGMRDLGAASPEALSPAEMRRLVPLVGATRLSQVEVDVPSGAKRPSGAADPQPPPVRVSVGEVELLADKPVDGVPSDLRIAIRNLAFPIPPNPDNDALKQLADLGYDRIDGSLATHLGWNEAGQELVVREMSVDGAGMGSFLLRGIVGGVTRDVFSPDSAVASVAFLGATAKSLEAVLENRGLFERVVAREARRQKRNPEDVRREYGMAAAVGIPAILGGSAGAKTLAQSVARFVAKPGKLTIRARAKQPAGFGVADLAAAPDPASVLEKLEITAVAE